MRPTSRLILTELSQTLQLWDDFQSIASLQKRILKLKDPKMEEGGVFSIGDASAAALGNYQEFPAALLNKTAFDPLRFLPRVPKDKEYLDKITYARMTHGPRPEPVIAFPYLLSQWLATKKVFRLENPDVIFSRKTKRTNYLKLLPCDAFVISFLEPIEITYNEEYGPLIRRYSAVIVARSGDLIDTFWIPDNVEEGSLSERSRKLLKKLLGSKSIQRMDLNNFVLSLPPFSLTDPDPEKSPNFILLTFHVEKCFMYDSSFQRKTDLKVINLYMDFLSRGIFRRKNRMMEESNGRFSRFKNRSGLELPKLEKDHVKLPRFFFNVLNTFCFLMSEIKPRNPDLVQDGQSVSGNDITQSFVWNEIPITKVDYLEEDPLSNTLKISYGSSEKSPHIRRGHWRHFINDDGSTRKVWIAQIMVRADKLEKGDELKGNVTIIREKRLVKN